MLRFQAIERIKGQAEFLIVEGDQILASLFRHISGIKSIFQIIRSPDIHKAYRFRVIHDIAAVVRQDEIADQLQGYIILVILINKIDAVFTGLQCERVSIAFKGSIALLEQGRFTVCIITAGCDDVHERCIRGNLDKRVIVVEFDGILDKIDLYGIAVLSGQNDDVTVFFDLKIIAFPAFGGFRQRNPAIEHFLHGLQGDIWHVRLPVQKGEFDFKGGIRIRKALVQRHRLCIDLIGMLVYGKQLAASQLFEQRLVLIVRFVGKRSCGQSEEQKRSQQNAQDSFHQKSASFIGMISINHWHSRPSKGC